MTDSHRPEIGAVAWVDLTVENAEQVRDFYANVAGWQPSEVDMGDYSDFNMTAPSSGKPMAGICHARGTNADLPPQWMIYITVDDVDASASRCQQMGGSILAGPLDMGDQGRYCIIQDPAGAVAGLFAIK